MQFLLNNPYFLLGIGILAVVDFFLLVVFSMQFRRYLQVQKLLRVGTDEGTMEEVLVKHKKILDTHNKNLTELGKIMVELIDHQKLAVQRVGMVRFNPFGDTGGNMSFVLALLDGQNNGILISSLHGREGTRIYAKALDKGVPTAPLTEEEKSAIGKAQSGTIKKRKV